MTDRQQIYRQTEAEFAFARSLDAEGVAPERFMAAWGLTRHQFNLLAQITITYGVNDEQESLPPLRAWQEAPKLRVA